MAIPNFFQQQQQSLQTGLGLGQAMVDAQQRAMFDPMKQQMMQGQVEAQGIQNQLGQQNIADQGLRTQQGEANLARTQQQTESQKKDDFDTGLRQDIAMLFNANQSEDLWNKVYPDMMAKYGNIAGIKDFMEMLGSKDMHERNKGLLMMQSALNPDQKPVTDKKPTKVAELEAAGYVMNTPEFQEAMKSLIFKDTEGLTNLKPSDVKGINADVTALVSPWKEVYRATKDLQALGKARTGPNQMAIIFKFMKTLDPASTVRESEYDAAKDTAGVGEKMWNMAHKALNGTFLSDVQVEEFISAAKLLANSRAEDVSGSVAGYLEPYGNMIDKTRKKAFLARAKTTLFDIPKAKMKPTELLPTPSMVPAPQAAISLLLSNPDMAEQFKAKYGYLPGQQ